MLLRLFATGSTATPQRREGGTAGSSETPQDYTGEDDKVLHYFTL